MYTVREPAVAGFFYPADVTELCESVDRMLAQAVSSPLGTNSPRALIAPHAGHRFSGPTAAQAYVRIPQNHHDGRQLRVLLLGPTHHVGIRGVADPEADAFRTPLGEVAVDATLMASARELSFVHPASHVHAQEHSLEVHLPFLQRLAAARETELSVAPLAVGEASPTEVAQLIAAVTASDPNVLVLVSSDLSHFERYEAARRHDAATIQRIFDLDPTLTPEDACGVRPTNGLLVHARSCGWRPELIAACNSGDTPDGDHRRVVGYASFEFTDAKEHAA